MRVLVTGGSGKLGTFVVQNLVDHGHQVVSIDQRPPSDAPDGLRFVKTDLHDIGQIAGAMRGCEAVIHLGAIPQPYGNPDEVVFANNTQATFAVFQAASLLGIKRVAFASSCSAYGAAWSPVPLHPRYAPVDEDHPLDNHDAYGLSKEVDERTAEMFARRDGMQIAALRFHWVATAEELRPFAPDGLTEHAELARLLWGYIEARDAANACWLAIEADFGGFEPFNIVAADTLSAQPTEELIRDYLPNTELRAPISANGSGFSIEKAGRLLGWQPEHSWQHPVAVSSQ
jgi:nucleoside-diphosphate-sugar epimerase